jgi:hypothetical protein
MITKKSIACDERGVSVVLGAILLLLLALVVFSSFYPAYLQSATYQRESEHMSSVRDSFAELKSKIDELRVGEQKSVGIKMSPDSVQFSPGPMIGSSIDVRSSPITKIVIYPSEDAKVEENGWTKRRPITIVGHHPENYQIKIVIPYDPDMRSDYGDLRFYENEAAGKLSYWVESCTQENAIVWVRRVENSDNTIYVYYGNPSATSESNGISTFIFFDDFESGNLSKWVNVIDSTWSIASDQKHSGIYSLRASAVSGTDKFIVASGVNESDVAFDAWWRLSSTSMDISQAVRTSSSTPINDYEINWEASDWALAKMINGSWYSIITTTGNPPTPNTWFKITAIIKGTEMKILKDDAQLLPSSGWQDVGGELGSGSVGFRAWDIPSGEYWWVDDARVRKFVDPEPVAIVGDEESVNGGASLQVASKEGSNVRSFLKFLLENVPPDSYVVRAALWLYCYEFSLPLKDVTDVLVRAVSDDSWQENEISWASMPIVGDALDSKFINSTGWISFEVKELVGGEVKGDRTASLALVCKIENYDLRNRYLNFYSREGPLKPYLEIYFLTGLAQDWVQTDWSGGRTFPALEVGKWDVIYNKYFTGENENSSSPGEIRLENSTPTAYKLYGFIESSIYDAGQTVNFGRITWDASTPTVTIGENKAANSEPVILVDGENRVGLSASSYVDAQEKDDVYENITENATGMLSSQAFSPENYNLLGGTRWVSGSIENLSSEDNAYMVFVSYPSAYSSQTLYAHQELTTISGTGYYSLRRESADNVGTDLQVLTGTVGRHLFGRFVYPLTGVSSIPSSTWNFYYRAWHSGASPENSTLRPNAAGTYQDWSTFGTGTSHWDRVSDQNDATGVQVSGSTTLKETFNIENITRAGTINSVTAYMRAKVTGQTLEYAQISFVGSTSATANNPTSGSFTLPTGWQPGDFAIFVWYTYANTKTFTPPSGITQKYQTAPAGYGRLYIGYRVLQSGDSSFSWSSSNVANSTTVWITSVFRNVDVDNPWDNDSGPPVTFTDRVNPDPPAVATLTDNAVVYCVFGKRNDYTSITPPSGYTNSGSGSSTAGVDASAGTAYKTKTPAGYEDPGAWTLGGGATSDDGQVWTGALRPASSNPEEKAVFIWRTYSTDYESAPITISRTDFTEYSETRTTNPSTGQTWTWDEVNSLEVGARASTLGGTETLQVSEFWIVVEYVSPPLAHVDASILIRRSDNTVRQIIAENVANSASLTETPTTLSATYSWSDYNVVDETDYLEIDLYCDVIVAGGTTAYLRIDNGALPLNDQTRVENIYLPSEYTAEVEFTGSSNLENWVQLMWSFDSAWTTGSVNVTLQLYDYLAGSYPTSGDGSISYVSSSTENTDEIWAQTINVNPENFRDPSGNWKLKIKGVKSTSEQFYLKADWVEYKPSWGALEYKLRWEHRIENVDASYENYQLLIYGYNSTNDENVGVYIWRSADHSWAFVGDLPSYPTWIIYPIDNIANYIVGENVSVLYFENNADNTPTTIRIDFCALEMKRTGTTTVVVKTRTGATENAYDGTWSAWQAATNGGYIPSPGNRYIQYRVELATTNSSITPILFGITLEIKVENQISAYGSVEFSKTNDFYPDQSYLYECGSVLLEQDDVYVMLFPPNILLVENMGGNNIKVYSTFIYITDSDQTLSATGRATIYVNVKRISDVVAPIDGPNRENVEINVRTIYRGPWDKFLSSEVQKLDQMGFDVHYDPNTLTLVIYGQKNGAPAGVKDIFYFERLVEVSVGLSK